MSLRPRTRVLAEAVPGSIYSVPITLNPSEISERRPSFKTADTGVGLGEDSYFLVELVHRTFENDFERHIKKTFDDQSLVRVTVEHVASNRDRKDLANFFGTKLGTLLAADQFE